MTAQFNPDVRALYEDIIKRNVVPRDEFDYMPQRYGGGRVREEALCGNDGHYPSISQIENSNFGGAYGRSEYPIAVGSGRKCGGVGVLKQAKVEPFINELDQDYMPVSSAHGAGRAPRLTKAIKQQILDMHPELKAHMLRGGAVNWGKIWKGVKDTLGFVSKAAPIAAQIAGPEYSDDINKVGNISGAISGMGRGGMKKMIFGESAASKARREEREARRQGSERTIRTQQANQAAAEASRRHNAEIAFESEVDRLRSEEKARKGRPLTMAEQYLKEKRAMKGKGGSMSLAADLLGNYATRRRGRGFWQDFGTGFKKGFKETAKIAAPALGIASIFQPELLPLAAATGVASKAMGNGRKRMTLPKSGHKREVARGDIVSAIMRQRGVGLGEASRIVKQEGLY